MNLTDTPATGCPTVFLGGALDYSNQTLSILEMRAVIDLTSTPGTETPVLYFWSRREVGSSDEIRVEVAQENTSDTAAQAYNNMGGWNAWQSASWSRSTSRVDTWLREQVNLTPWRGQKIRIRFVLDAANGSGIADGWHIDNVRVSYVRNQIAIPFTSVTSALPSSWVREGNWGAARDVFWLTGITGGFTDSSTWTMDVYNYTFNNAVSFGSPLISIPGITDIDFFIDTGAPYTGGPTNNFLVHFTRQNMQLTPGTYTFSVIGEEGYILYFNNNSGTNVSNLCTRADITTQYCIIERWITHGDATLSARTINVTSTTPANTTLSLDWFEDGSDADLAMSVTRDQFSFTDSPNSGTISTPGSNYVLTESVRYGESSLMLNGYFNTSAVSGTQYLKYRRLFSLTNGSNFSVEYSTDGGFSWSAWWPINWGDTENISGWAITTIFDMYGQDVNEDPNDWDEQGDSNELNLPEGSNIMIRFRLSTTGTGDNSTLDGMYLTDISVS
jgi:hypothetical protein